ncbi:MAG: SLC13 family permease [Alphaproteobacteria bacterium]|nr:SLC13 family permease [Alphaproteobacteria bacterium]
MTPDQITVFAIIGVTVAVFIWDKWRYDLVALAALFASVVLGVVPAKDAFSGMGDPVVITVATILVISAAVSRSGFIDLALRMLSRVSYNPYLQTGLLVTLVVALSGFMNNVGALAVFLPIAIAAAKKAGRSPSESLMPLAFGSLLGGSLTLIGTPPNILISRIREEAVGAPYAMFDFAPVGLAICAVGIVYLAFGWRLIPRDRTGATAPEDRFTIEDYVSEVRVAEGSSFIGMTLREMEESIEGDISVVGIVREKQRKLMPSRRTQVKVEDFLMVKCDPIALKELVDKGKLELTDHGKLEKETEAAPDDIGVVEAVIMAGSEMVNSTARQLSLRSRFGVNLLAIRKSNKKANTLLSSVRLHEGDVVVLQGNLETMPETLREIGCLPLAERNLQLGRGRKAVLPVIILAVAVLLSTFEVVPISIAFLGGVLAIALFKILRLHEIYAAIDAPVLILLAALMPVTAALQTVGGTDLIATGIADLAQNASPPMVLTLILVASMAVTPFLNNAAAVLLMGPIAAGLAVKLGLNVDAFLMAVAIGASCDFLTPIGHQSNTLVMGPGGYKFSDYWRMGLPLTILVILVSVPMLMIVWPLQG